MTDRFSSAPQPSYRFVPSRFPPIGLFDTVSTAADLEAVMELAGWTNDRLVAQRVQRLPKKQWVYGRPNASIVMASFLHAAPEGLRFNEPDLGAWYAAADIRTAAAEVGHHLRREAVARKVKVMNRSFRSYSATLAGADYRDIRGDQATFADIYRSDSYAASQPFGEAIRKAGHAGILYDSLRHRGGSNVVAYVPTNIHDVTQTDHYEIGVEAAGREIIVRRLAHQAQGYP